MPTPVALVRIVHNIGGIEQPYFNDAIDLTYAGTAQAFESVGVWRPRHRRNRHRPGRPRGGARADGEPRTLHDARRAAELGRWFSVEEDCARDRRTR